VRQSIWEGKMTSQGHVADGGLMWLVNCLNATLDADPQIRTAAEEGLKQASLHTGYGIALAKVTVSKEMPLGLRQISSSEIFCHKSTCLFFSEIVPLQIFFPLLV
jgi:hypothetical protein